MYYPNREPAVYLKCKCIVSSWGMIRELGGGKYQDCDEHGEQKILRKPTIKDQLRWIRAHPLDSYTRSKRYQNETLF